MSKMPKALVIVRDDASSTMTWSGIPNHIIKILRDYGVSVQVIDKLGFPTHTLWRLQRLISKIFNLDLPKYYSMSTSRYYGRLLQKEISKRENDHDFILAIDFTEGLPYFENSKPTFVFRDASYLQLNDISYPGYEDFSASDLVELKKIESKAFESCDKVLITSRWSIDYCQKYHPHIPKDKYRVLPFSSQIYPPPVRSDWQLRDMSRQTVIKFLFVGRDWARKGGDKAVQILEELAIKGLKVTLTIVGANPTINSDLIDFNIIENLDCNDVSDKQKMIELYQSSHFFILPINIEAFGIVFSEAMSFGLPIITHDVCALPEILEDNVEGICVNYQIEPKDVAPRVVELVDNIEKYHQMQEACFCRFEKKFHPKSWVKNLLSFLD